LTKRYEEARHGSFEELIDSVTENAPRGELVVLVGPPLEDTSWDAARVTSALEQIIPEDGVKRASAQVAEMSGWAKRDVYALALNLKK
jgi:16S rRNA (cytidine1402-2'-O)-methyltransferase